MNGKAFKSVAALAAVVVAALGGALFSPESSITQGNTCGTLGDRYRVTVVAAAEEAIELAAICEQSLSTLQSSEFRSNLLAFYDQYPEVVRAASINGPAMVPSSQLANAVQLNDASLYKFRNHFVLLGTYFDTGPVYSGQCRWRENTKACNAYEFEDNRNNEFAATRIIEKGTDSILESVIGRKIHQRWRSISADRQSCAINTFVHELLHGFSANPTSGFHQNYFVDTLQLNQSAAAYQLPIATYFVGSVAQCTWLQQRNNIQPGFAALNACVNRFGIDRFNSLQCQ